MRALVIICSSAEEAAGVANGLRANGWNVIVTGPVEGLEVRNGANSDFSDGSWIVLASREEIQQP